ncbi:unnamed protein product, partial [Meganyctiphanes norvegica]
MVAVKSLVKVIFYKMTTLTMDDVPITCNRNDNIGHEELRYINLKRSCVPGTGGSHSFCVGQYFGVMLHITYQVESEEAGDDTALNAIELECIQPTTNIPLGTEDIQERDFAISSLKGEWGDWRDLRTCSSGFLTGLRLKSEPDQGMFSDDTAANDLEMQCNWSSEIHNGGGDHWGDWSSWAYCPQGWAICGLETRVEDSTGHTDDTALNDVKMFCCELPQ